MRPPRPRLPRIRTRFDGKAGRVIEFEGDRKHGPVVYAVCDWESCPFRGQRHGPLPVTDEAVEPPHPIFQIILDR